MAEEKEDSHPSLVKWECRPECGLQLKRIVKAKCYSNVAQPAGFCEQEWAKSPQSRSKWKLRRYRGRLIDIIAAEEWGTTCFYMCDSWVSVITKFIQRLELEKKSYLTENGLLSLFNVSPCLVIQNSQSSTVRRSLKDLFTRDFTMYLFHLCKAEVVFSVY